MAKLFKYQGVIIVHLSSRDEERRKRRLGIKSLDEILDRRRMKWMEKVANMPATLDDNRLPRKLLGAWIFGGKRQEARGDQVANGRLDANLILICCVNK